MLVWLDLETTGLDPLRDSILEIGFIVTDDNLKEIALSSWVLPFRSRHNLVPLILKMHTVNGLLDECEEVSNNVAVDAHLVLMQINQFLDSVFSAHPSNDRPPLCGSSVDFDRGFFRASIFHTTLSRFSHRVIDVSSLKELAKRWAPDIYHSVPRIDGAVSHRVIDDLRNSIAELKHYRLSLFPPSQE